MMCSLQGRRALPKKLQILRTLTNSESEVKVEKIGEQFMIRVKCDKGENMLVSILEAFEEMGLIALQASVSCNNLFSMEATCVAQNQQALDARDVTQVILKAIEKQAAEDWEISKSY